MNHDRISLLRLQRDYSWAKEEWFVPLAVALEGVTAAEAAWQPPGGGNTIWQTVNHVNYWNEELLNRLTGRTFAKLPNNDATFGEPGDPANADGWQATLAYTHRIAGQLGQALAARTDADLDQPLVGQMPLGEHLALWVMHDAYHAGQVALLRKQQGTWPARR